MLYSVIFLWDERCKQLARDILRLFENHEMFGELEIR